MFASTRGIDEDTEEEEEEEEAREKDRSVKFNVDHKALAYQKLRVVQARIVACTSEIEKYTSHAIIYSDMSARAQVEMHNANAYANTAKNLRNKFLRKKKRLEKRANKLTQVYKEYINRDEGENGIDRG